MVASSDTNTCSHHGRRNRRDIPDGRSLPPVSERLVVALGGNAIAGEHGAGPDAQREAVEEAAAEIADLVAAGHQVVLTHGNGPQVGNLLVKNDLARNVVPPVPLDWCVAQTQATLGFLIVTAMEAELRRRGIERLVSVVITRVLVSPDDPAWRRPTKPIGRWLSEAEARERIAAGENWEARGERGWRRVVPSPEPLEILDLATIRELVSAGAVVVAAGGGGIPMVRDGRDAARRRGRARQGPQRRAAGAQAVGVDCFVIATDVEAAAIRFGTPEQEWLARRRARAPALARRRGPLRQRQHGPEGGRGAAVRRGRRAPGRDHVAGPRARGRRGHGRNDRARMTRARDRPPRRLPRLGDADARLARGRGRGAAPRRCRSRWRRRSTSS